MEKDLLLLQDQVGGMDTVATDKWAVLKKRWAFWGHAQVDLALGTPCLGPVGLET